MLLHMELSITALGARVNAPQLASILKGALKNRSERLECKAHGTQQPRHTELGRRGASTAQHSNQVAQ